MPMSETTSAVEGERAWYVAKTKPRLEQQTATALVPLGIETYLPRIKPSRRGYLSARSELLFPGYLFVQLDLSTDWRRARFAKGISYFLGAEGAPTAVPDALVEEIRAQVERRQKGWQSLYRKGERVRVVGGPLDGLEAIFEEGRSGAHRSLILVEIVSRLVRVEVESSRLWPARPEA